MHLNRENTWEPVRIQFSLSGVAQLHRSAAKAASHSGKAKVVGWHCRRAKVRSQFPAPGEGCAESAAMCSHGRPAGSNHRPFLAFTGIDARAERPRGRRGRIRGARFIGEYVPIRFRFRCVFLADGTKRVCIQGVREVRMEKVKASLYIIPVFLEFEGVEILYNM